MLKLRISIEIFVLFLLRKRLWIKIVFGFFDILDLADLRLTTPAMAINECFIGEIAKNN